MFKAIAAFSVRFRWLIIAIWIAAVPVLNHYLPSITSVSKTDTSSFLPSNSPTQKAMALNETFQGKNSVGSAIVVVSRSGGQLTPADMNALEQLGLRLKQDKHVSATRYLGTSKDGQAAQLFVGVSSGAFGPNEGTVVVNDLRAQIHRDMPAGLQINLTGEIPQAVDSQKASDRGRNNTEGYTVILIIVLLLVVFRSLLAPIVTLVPAVLALLVAQPLIAESSKIGVQVSPITEILLVVLLLGAGTDYGLFLVFRVREELRRGLQPKEAVREALTHVGESITFSAATVGGALLCLILATFGIYKGLGPGLAIGLGVMLLAALTFLPAVLSILGRAVFWPSKTAEQELKIGLWGRVADSVIKRPLAMLAVGIVVFAALSAGLIGYRTVGFNNDTPTNSRSDSAIGQTVIDQHFPSSGATPDSVLLVFNKPVWTNLGAVQKAQQQLAASNEFKTVTGPFSANGFTITPKQLEQLHKSGAAAPQLIAASQFFSGDGKTVRFLVTTRQAAGSADAIAATPAVRATVQTIANRAGATDSAVIGQDTAAYDINRVATSDLKRIIPVVLVVIGILLAIMLRSVIAPIYLIVTVGLSYLAALGFAMIAFVHLGDSDGLNFILPFMMFIFSMALGEDYNILVMSRIREEARRDVSLDAAVTKAVGITGTTVTSAGLILAGTFAIFGLVGGSKQFQEIGYAIAFGILLDTFFVRTLLVPSIVSLLGEWNWWPSKLRS